MRLPVFARKGALVEVVDVVGLRESQDDKSTMVVLECSVFNVLHALPKQAAIFDQLGGVFSGLIARETGRGLSVRRLSPR